MFLIDRILNNNLNFVLFSQVHNGIAISTKSTCNASLEVF